MGMKYFHFKIKFQFFNIGSVSYTIKWWCKYVQITPPKLKIQFIVLFIPPNLKYMLLEQLWQINYCYLSILFLNQFLYCSKYIKNLNHYFKKYMNPGLTVNLLASKLKKLQIINLLNILSALIASQFNITNFRKLSLFTLENHVLLIYYLKFPA